MTYSVIGPDSDKVTIDLIDGQVRFNESPDYESGKTVYEFTVVASDGELTASQDVTLNVNDVNEAPEFVYPAAFMSIAENIDTSQVIWSADATDVDGDVLSYSLSGEDAGYFSVSALGAVSFNESPDYESGKTLYDFSVVASDGSLESEQVVRVNIWNDQYERYELGSTELASGGVFAGEVMDDVMDGSSSGESLSLSGGEGNDVLTGGSVDDILNGGEGNDRLSGGSGNDVLITGSGVDRVDGGDGIDTIVLGSEAGDVTTVNLGREWQYSDGGWNLIRNVENVTMGSGNDIIQGNDVSNVITAGAGDDWLYGGAGDDVLIGGEGADRLFGGEGNDTVLYDTDEDLSVSLSSTGGLQFANRLTSVGMDKLEGVENIVTGSGDDTLVGDANANVLTGGSGDDTLTGGAGDDVFRFYASEGLSTDVITDFSAGDSIELVDDTGSSAVAQITSDANGSTVTWDELTIVLDVVIDYDDINPIS